MSIFITAALSALFIATYPLLILSGSHEIDVVVQEDGILEAVGALLFFAAAVLCAACAIRAHRRSEPDASELPVFYLLLSLLFFLAFGEEISWGQRVFGWITPEKWSNLNVQNETNLHNLWILFEEHPNGSPKSTLALLFLPERLFTLFFVLYTIVVPVLHALSGSARTLVRRVGLPVPSLSIGVLFASAYLGHRIVRYHFGLAGAEHALEELRETLYATVALILALQFYVSQRGIPQDEARSD